MAFGNRVAGSRPAKHDRGASEAVAREAVASEAGMAMRNSVATGCAAGTNAAKGAHTANSVEIHHGLGRVHHEYIQDEGRCRKCSAPVAVGEQVED
jgi:hypothetical protein